MTAPARLAVTEAQLQEQVVQLARLRGWWVWHDNGTQGRNQAGLPDLILVRERVVWAELKTDRGRLRSEQRHVIARLRAAGQEVHIWRPAGLAEVARVLAPAGIRAVAPPVPVEEMRARLAAVVALHRPYTSRVDSRASTPGRLVEMCGGCGARHPCPTVRAARGEG